MADYTENLNLILPKPSEKYDVEVANKNNEIIDIQIAKKVSKIVGKGLSTNDFTNEYKKKVDSLQTLYRFKGYVDTVNDLNSIVNKEKGDIYSCKEDSKDYIWNGTEWIAVGENTDFSEIMGMIEDLQDDKVDKAEGKGLSTNDYTTDEKNKLQGIEAQANKTIIENSLTSNDTTKALSANQGKELKGLIDNIETNRYKITLEADLADNSQITVPTYYKVGTDSLKVFFEGCLLEKDVHYTEVRRSKQHK